MIGAAFATVPTIMASVHALGNVQSLTSVRSLLFPGAAVAFGVYGDHDHSGQQFLIAAIASGLLVNTLAGAIIFALAAQFWR